jgi:RNA polymerase sigma-70 factor (ECF subfamily)
VRDPPEIDVTEAGLITRARAGDNDAYAQLVRDHQTVALRVAAFVGDAGLAEDAVQEAFVKAYIALGRFDSSRPFRPWFLTIVANEARSRARTSRRTEHLVERLAAQSGPETSESTEDLALARIGSTELTDALLALREDDQSALALRFVLDLGEAETAAVLGCRVGTVKSRTSRALGRLREALEEANR